MFAQEYTDSASSGGYNVWVIGFAAAILALFIFYLLIPKIQQLSDYVRKIKREKRWQKGPQDPDAENKRMLELERQLAERQLAERRAVQPDFPIEGVLPEALDLLDPPKPGSSKSQAQPAPVAPRPSSETAYLLPDPRITKGPCPHCGGVDWYDGKRYFIRDGKRLFHRVEVCDGCGELRRDDAEGQ